MPKTAFSDLQADLLMLVFILSRVVSGGKEALRMLAMETGQVLAALAFEAFVWKLGWLGAARFDYGLQKPQASAQRATSIDEDVEGAE
jgi:hypothetical protein